MTKNPDQLDSRSTKDLARACAQQSSRPHASEREPGPCYELLRRAFAHPPDDAAWQAILNQYHKLVFHWLGPHASDDAVQEVFLRFWKAQKSASPTFITRFPNIKAVMGYLKRCAATVRIEARREEERRRKLWERLQDVTLVEQVLMRAKTNREHTDFDFKDLVQSKTQDEREHAVLELMYYHDLTSREVQAERPDLFPKVQVVYRVKENLLKRLRRDQELEQYWTIHHGKGSDNGGKTASLSI